MPRNPKSFELSLAKSAIFAISDAAGIEIRCVSGSVWVTLDHDSRDIVLGAPDATCFASPEHRRALIQALEPSSIVLSPRGQPAAASTRSREIAPSALVSFAMQAA